MMNCVFGFEYSNFVIFFHIRNLLHSRLFLIIAYGQHIYYKCYYILNYITCIMSYNPFNYRFRYYNIVIAPFRRRDDEHTAVR